jgi:DnaJ-domain-containing protein 1
MNFERNKVDNISQSSQQVAIAAEVRFDTGEVEAGQFFIQASRPFTEVLNGGSPFIEFEVYGEARRWVSKSSIRDVKLTPAPKPGDLKAKALEIDYFEPHRVLGVEQNAEWADVRASYVALSKIYHPDNFANVSLPSEVNHYLAAISRRINLAYAALETKHSTAKAIAQRVKPIYESQPRM